MPNRIIKESICYSEDIEALEPLEEIFYYRLIVNVDDYGRIDARPSMLKAKLFPISKRVSDEDIHNFRDTIVKHGLAIMYYYEKRPYLQILKWDKHQQIRAKRSKCPSLDDADEVIDLHDINCNHMISDDIRCPRESESESISESKSQSESKSESISVGEKRNRIDSPPIDLIINLYHEICTSLPRVSVVTDERKKLIRARWKQTGRTLNSFETVFLKAENSEFLSGRSGKWTGCNFDWLMKQANFIKVGEGTYDTKQCSNAFLQALKELEDKT